MSRRLLSHSFVGLSMGFLGGIVGCTAPDLSQPCPIPPGATEAERQAALNACFKVMSADVVDTKLTKDIDVLFLVDNSTSMSPKQKAIASAIPTFIQKIDGTKSNYHIGVVTSDIGTLPPGKTSFPGSTEQRCNTAKGDDGLLQNKACSTRIPASDQNTEFALACKGAMSPLCPDASFVPQDLWIAKDGTKVNVVPTNPGTLTASEIAQRAFQCVGLVGDYGCGVESPLEAVKRALDGHLPENKGFLRDNSVLAIIFITDEDDCSVQLSQRQNLDPANTNCGTSNPDPDYKCYNLDYRCVAKSTVCDEPLNTPGLKHNCRERTGNFLEPVDKYVKFLSALRPKEKLVIAGIWTPSIQDFQARGATGDGKLEIDGTAGDFSTNVLNRGQKLKAACYDPDPMMKLTTSPQGFFGQAQHRLSSFIRKFDPSVYVEQSICAAANYGTALDRIAEKVVKAVTGDCLAVKPLIQNGQPACLVGFVDANQPDSLPDTYLPQCSATCCNAWASDPKPVVSSMSIQTACMPEAKDCYCAVTSTVSPEPNCKDTAVAGVWRAGNQPAPSGKVVNFRCAGTRPPTAATYDEDISSVEVQ